jgi:agmatinase
MHEKLSAKRPIRTTAVVFPFDLFGNSGTGAGAELLGDVLKEIQADTAAETRPTRPAAYAPHLKLREISFETLDELTAWRTVGRQVAKKALSQSDFVLWLGGNHLSVLPIYEELKPDTLVIQFDAHLDIYNLHDCTIELSPGNFLLHAAGPLPRIVNIGSRDLFLLPKPIERTFEKVYPTDALNGNFGVALTELTALVASAERVWIDFDADVVDPQFLPGVCQPMPFGLTPPQLLAVLMAIWSDKVIGVSFSEFAPGRDVRDTGLNFLGWLMEWFLLKRYEPR